MSLSTSPPRKNRPDVRTVSIISLFLFSFFIRFIFLPLLAHILSLVAQSFMFLFLGRLVHAGGLPLSFSVFPVLRAVHFPFHRSG